MMRVLWLAPVLTLVVALALSTEGRAGAEEGDLATVRAKFEGLSKAEVVAMGYTPELLCVSSPAGFMGFHAERYPLNEDNVVNAAEPELLLLDGSGRVIGIEYETRDAIGPPPALFGHTFEFIPGHPGKEWPHYILHIYFRPNGENHIATWEPRQSCPTPPVSPSVARAEALIQDATGEVIGYGHFAEDSLGYVAIDLRVERLAAGHHGLHLHAVGRCEGPAFLSAGGHFNPLSTQHGLLNPDGPHAGDLPALQVDSTSIGHIRVTTDRVRLAPGALSLFDLDGTAVVVHADDDDQVTDATGNSGARLACGVLRQLPTAGPRGDRIPVVEGLYQALLCRGSDFVGLMAGMNSSLDAEGLRAALAGSPEGRRAAAVRAIYQELLGRDPMAGDCGGLRSWVDGPLTIEQIRQVIADSPERRGRRQ